LSHHLYRDMDRSHYCPWNNDLANMYKFFWKRANADAEKFKTVATVTKKLNPAVLTLAQWVKKNKHDLHLVLKTIHPDERMLWWLALVYTPQNHSKFEYYH